jgi:hypothetical protein
MKVAESLAVFVTPLRHSNKLVYDMLLAQFGSRGNRAVADEFFEES